MESRLQEWSASQMRDAFNASLGSVRLVALLSPTCGMCIDGHRHVASVFHTVSSGALCGLLSWEPILEADTLPAAQERSGEFKDSRLAQGWDTQREVEGLFKQTLRLQMCAWDVYLLYDAEAVWSDALPPTPDFWMHQLPWDDHAPDDRLLDPETLTDRVLGLLPQTEPAPTRESE